MRDVKRLQEASQVDISLKGGPREAGGTVL